MDVTKPLIPADGDRGLDFWMLNDRLDEGELRRQLRALRAQGFASVIVRTYIGLRSDYPGPDFKAKMRAVVDEARAVGMKLVMQAGYMPEAVLDLPVEYSLMSVNRYDADKAPTAPADVFDGVAYCVEPTNTILDMLSPDASRFYVRQSYEEMWRAFRDEFGKTIVSVWVDEPSYAHAELPWTPGLPAAFRALWGEDFPTDGLHLLFVDGNGAATLRHRYWRTVLYLMKRSYFSAVRDWCRENGVEFSGHLMAEDTMEAQIRATCFTMPFYKYFDLPGIDYLTCAQNWRYGEIRPEHDDTLGEGRRQFVLTANQCVSAAHQAGQKRVLCEMYGVSTDNLTLRDQKQIFDRFAAVGITHRSVHGVFYSLRGRGKRAYPPHVAPYQPYWEKYRLLTDAVARESAFLKTGEPVRDLLVVHPMGSAFCEYRPRHKARPGDDANAALGRRDRALFELLRFLTGVQSNFALGDEDTMAECGGVEGGRLAVGAMRYRAVLLPDLMTLRASTLALLERFGAAGGTVIARGRLPELLDGAPDASAAARLAAIPGFLRVSGDADLAALLARLPAAFRWDADGDGTPVVVHYREDGADRLVFLSNTDCREGRSGVLRVPGRYAAYLVGERDGVFTPTPVCADGAETRVRVRLGEGGSAMLALVPTKAANAPRAGCGLRPTGTRYDFDGAWTLDRLDPNALVLEFARFARGGDALSAPYPILAVQELLAKEKYRGEITLEYTFRNDVPLAGAYLAAESPELQAFELDGAPLANAPDGYYLAFAFERLPLPTLAPGEHTLTVRRHFEPLRAPSSAVTSLFENLGGVELEPMYLVGDFALRSVLEPCADGVAAFAPDFTLTADASETDGDVTRAGCAFYAGRAALTRRFVWDGAPGRVTLALDGLYAAAASVAVNGADAGDFAWQPYALDITGLLRPGENEITVTLYGTIRNLLGPWHRPEGEIGAAWGGYEQPNKPWLGARDAADTDWLDRRATDTRWWTEKYLAVPFGLVGAHLVAE